MENPSAILMGPFVGELYWEAGRFAPMLMYFKQQYRKQNVKFIILTREDRFDLYGRHADILVPLRIPGDYGDKMPECFRLQGLGKNKYDEIVRDFKNKYETKFNIIKHIYPDINKPHFQNKNQFARKQMLFNFSPRKKNYELVENFLPNHGKPLVVLAPRFRKGFRRNWKHWESFYDLLYKNKDLIDNFNFIICGKEGEYRPDGQKRFLNMNDIVLEDGASLIGLLMVILEKAFFTFGSQSAIPNISLLYKVDVLEFGCQQSLHTRTYNIHNSPITFIDNKQYNIEPEKIIKKLRELLYKKKEKIDHGKTKERLVNSKQKQGSRSPENPSGEKLPGCATG
jgi:hypothetical protein